MRLLARSCLLLALALPALATTAEPARRPLAEVVDAAVAASAAQYRWLLPRVPADALPRTFEHGKLQLAGEAGRDWTRGFFPGSLWFLFEATGDAAWKDEANRRTALLERERHNRGTHDVGFLLFCSYGQALRLDPQPGQREVLLDGAAALASRFVEPVGATKSWDWGARRGWDCPVIIDNMMNLELLLWAAETEPRHRELAIRHADTTLRHHFRPDGSTWHVVDYDAKTGAVRAKVTHQGRADDSAWSRGQAWAIYGYTLMYRFTREARYLEQARRTTEFVMNHPRLPADKVPYWDFDDPNIPDAPRDSSAAAIIASALFELADHVGGADGARYRAFAEEQVRSLASPAYLAAVGENGGFILKHATGNLPRNSEIDTPLNYGDYYFLEALLRARAAAKR